LALGRGIQFFLGLGLTGLWLFLGSGPLGDPRPGAVGDRAFFRLANPTPVAPKAVAVDEVGGQAPPAILSLPEVERKNPGETLPVTVRGGTGQSPRLPAQIANLVKRQNLERVMEKYARQYGVDQNLVWAVIHQELGFNPHTVSPKGSIIFCATARGGV